jgi:hypothetical protein
MTHHRVKDGQQLEHAGDERDFLGRPQPGVASGGPLCGLSGGTGTATSAFVRCRSTEGGSACRVHGFINLSSRCKELRS